MSEVVYITVNEGIPGVGVPTGGTTGQVLTKLSGANYDTGWEDAGGGGAVTSVFGRTGAVTAQNGDYTPAQVGAPGLDAPSNSWTAQNIYGGASIFDGSATFNAGGGAAPHGDSIVAGGWIHAAAIMVDEPGLSSLPVFAAYGTDDTPAGVGFPAGPAVFCDATVYAPGLTTTPTYGGYAEISTFAAAFYCPTGSIPPLSPTFLFFQVTDDSGAPTLQCLAGGTVKVGRSGKDVSVLGTLGATSGALSGLTQCKMDAAALQFSLSGQTQTWRNDSSITANRTVYWTFPDAAVSVEVAGDCTISGTNTGDQTSIVGITGTRAEFNVALSDGEFIYRSDDLYTPSAGTLTNCTGLPVATGISGLGTGVAAMLAAFSSANVRAACTDETGTGALVFANGNIGNATASSVNNVAITAAAISGATLTIADGGALATVGANSITLTSTATTSVTLPTSGTLVNQSRSAGMALVF